MSDTRTTKWFEAAKTGDVAALRVMLSSGIDVNITNSDGMSALHLAAARGKKDGVATLIRTGVDVNAANKGGWTALHVAVSWGRTEVAELLIRAGADIEALSNERWTPLHAATWNCHSKSVGVLVVAGANPEAKSIGGMTARDLAYLRRRGGFLAEFDRIVAAAPTQRVTRSARVTTRAREKPSL